MGRVKIKLKPRPGFQTDVLQSPADYILMGGEAGPGKTWSVIFCALFDYNGQAEPMKMYNVPGYVGLICRRESTQLEKIKADAKPIYESFGARWKGQEKNCWVFPSGAKVYMRHMKNLSDWQQFQGWEIHYFAPDEIPNFEESQISWVMNWMRSTIKGVRARLLATANPEGIGLDFVKRWWNIKCPCPIHGNTNEPFGKDENNEIVPIDATIAATTWHFIPVTKKGSVIEELDPKYEARLAVICGGRDTPRFRALANGCWEVSRGALFSIFSKIHIIPDDMIMPNANNWTRFGGHDYASSPTGDAFGYVDGIVNQNRDIVIETETFGWGHSVEMQASKMISSTKQCRAVYSGEDVFSQNQGGEINRTADLFYKAGVTLQKMKIKDASAASMIMQAMFATINGSTGCVFIRERCKRLIADLTLLQAHPKEFDRWNTEQRITVNGNHYHFDVFHGFKSLVCGVYSSDDISPVAPRLPEKRQKAIERANQRVEENSVFQDNHYEFQLD